MRFLFAAFLLAVLPSAPAWAAFHLFTINEAYSNPNGSVQYVELTALGGGQQFVRGHTLRSTDGATTRVFTLTTDLPGDTSGRKLLLGTAGLQAAFGVTPDYVIPDGFLHTTGTIDWAEGSDVWAHPALPGNGQALFRDGSTGPPTPQNFANVVGGQTVTSYQALWWASPAGSENGWGINVTHQGNTLFATWFTYDVDGTGMWLVMSDAERVSEGIYSGALYRTTGPPFNMFTPGSNVQVTQVGTASFEFSSPGEGTFSYSFGGVLQSKRITRQVYSSPVSTCVLGGTPSSQPNYQDLWWRSPAGSESGWGLNITHQGSILFVTWFTYGADGKGLWLVAPDARQSGPSTYTGPLYRTGGNPFSSTPWNAASVNVSEVGSVTLSFTDTNNGTFAYTVDDISQSKTITRQVFANPPSVCGP